MPPDLSGGYLLRQWAYRQADGDKDLLQEIDNYINGLYEWLKHDRKKGRLDDIEFTRLKVQKESLTDKLHDYIPERLISGGQTSIEQLLDDIQNYEYAKHYPPNPSFKWQNSEIERLGLISERIKLLMRLIKKLSSECVAKYHYSYHLQEIVFDIASYTGTLELSRDKLDWGIIDQSIEEYKRQFNLHLSEIKEYRRELQEADKTDQERLQEMINALKQYKESGDKSALPPIRSVSDLLDKYEDQYTDENSINVIIMLGRAVQNDAGYYSELLNKLSSDEFMRDIEGLNYKDKTKAPKEIKFLKGRDNFNSKDANDYFQELEIAIRALNIPDFDVFATLVQKTTEYILSECHEDYNIYEEGNLLFFAAHFFKITDLPFPRSIFAIGEKISLIENQKQKPDNISIFEDIAKKFKKLMKLFQDAVYYAQNYSKKITYSPLSPVSIAWESVKQFKEDVVKSLSRKTDLDNPPAETRQETSGGNAEETKKPSDMSLMTPEARVLAVFADMPDLTITKIAENAGVHRTSLYRMEKFMSVWKMRKADEATSYKDAKPTGEKDGETGEIKAWKK